MSRSAQWCTIFLDSQRLLDEVEKDIKQYAGTVTAVVNLCSLLQFDRDAGK